jgi:hypothetical protein
VRISRIKIEAYGSVHHIEADYYGEPVSLLLGRAYGKIDSLRADAKQYGWVVVTLIDSKAYAKQRLVIEELFHAARCGEPSGQDDEATEARRMDALLKLSAIYYPDEERVH